MLLLAYPQPSLHHESVNGHVLCSETSLPFPLQLVCHIDLSHRPGSEAYLHVGTRDQQRYAIIIAVVLQTAKQLQLLASP
jgi:hypothetical protein